MYGRSLHCIVRVVKLVCIAVWLHMARVLYCLSMVGQKAHGIVQCCLQQRVLVLAFSCQYNVTGCCFIGTVLHRILQALPISPLYSRELCTVVHPRNMPRCAECGCVSHVCCVPMCFALWLECACMCCTWCVECGHMRHICVLSDK